jgi:DNA-binding response OmpR family regulator
MAKQRILVVANDAGFRATLARCLIAAGYSVELAESAKHARRVLAHERIGLAIVASDQCDGNELARELRAAVDRLILVTSPADGSMRQAVRADGYLSRPLREEDVLGQIDAVFRIETKPAEAAPELLCFGGYTLDTVAGSCLDASGGVVALTRAELTLLLSLARRLGRVVSRDDLTRAVTGRGAERGDRSVDVLISRLRRKIEANPKSPRIILTIPRVGYRLAVKLPIATYKAAALNSAETATEAAETASRRPHCRAGAIDTKVLASIARRAAVR